MIGACGHTVQQPVKVLEHAEENVMEIARKVHLHLKLNGVVWPRIVLVSVISIDTPHDVLVRISLTVYT